MVLQAQPAVFRIGGLSSSAGQGGEGTAGTPGSCREGMRIVHRCARAPGLRTRGSVTAAASRYPRGGISQGELTPAVFDATAVNPPGTV